MSHSHHSHSGQFCPGHAANTLEECIQTAISRNLTVFGLSEHMPRHFVDMYPEELASGTTYEWHLENEAAYFKEAQRLRSKYASQIEIVVGFESDWIRPESQELIERSIMMYDYDYFVGSVHHVHTVPIDYDQGMYDEARTRAGGTDERLFEDYFDAQFEMLKAVRPPVVGHFDLIRLKSQDPDVSGGWKSVGDCWGQIVRNLDLIREYGGTIEVNTAALRKGMKEPYPKRDVIEAALERRIQLCLSDDSHGVPHVANGYHKAVAFLEDCGVTQLSFLRHRETTRTVVDSRFPRLEIASVDLKSSKTVST